MSVHSDLIDSRYGLHKLKITMGKVYEVIDDKIREWIRHQKMFFVATAPNSSDGLVNCSPKGLDTFRVLDPRTIAYLDFTGSGVETIAHLKENGRIVIMMCAFDGSPKIFRFHGKGEVYEKGSDGYTALIHHFEESIGIRSIIKINVQRISDSCGWGVPLYTYESDRDTLQKVSSEWGEEKLAEFRDQNNRKNLDGLTGYESQ